MPDRREVLPLDRIDPAPWNPKYPIAGEAREGLKASLDHFGVRDDLKVWPNPDGSGRYYVLDGNQRLDVLRGSGMTAIECRILDDLDDEDARLFTAAFDRNKAFYHENKLAELSASLQAKNAELKDRLLRLPKVQLPEPDAMPAVATEAIVSDAPVPILFSVSRDTYDEIKGTLLKSKQRLHRESRLREAFAAFDAGEIDDVVAETILCVAARRMAK